jgi:hypothetical protein
METKQTIMTACEAKNFATDKYEKIEKENIKFQRQLFFALIKDYLSQGVSGFKFSKHSYNVDMEIFNEYIKPELLELGYEVYTEWKISIIPYKVTIIDWSKPKCN